MVELVLMVAGVCTPDTLDSLPKAELAVVGDARQYPVDEDGLSETAEEGRKPVLGGH